MSVTHEPIEFAHAAADSTSNSADPAPVTCVILAAGLGKRMEAGGESKPLVLVAGLALLERAIATAHQAGVGDFVVITGFHSDRVDAFLDDLRRRRRVAITSRYCPFWERGNGASLRCARDVVQGPFLLLMADHVMDERIIQMLLRHRLDGNDLILAVDRRVRNNDSVDLHDVTRVHVIDDRIRAIAKDLEPFNAFDTGTFICTPAMFDALDEALKAGDSSLSGAVQRLADAGTAITVSIGNAYWADVDTRAEQREVTARLYGQLVKPHDGWVSRTLNRPLSLGLFTPLLLRFFRRITPNQVSALSFLVGLVGALCLTLRQPIAAGIMIHLASVIDGSDGEIARLKMLATPLGSFLDAALDRYADATILLGLTYFVWADRGIDELLGSAMPALTILTGLLAVTGTLMVSYTSTKAQTDLGYRYAGVWIAAGRGRDWRLMVLVIGTLLAAVHGVSAFVALALIAISTNAIVVWRAGVSWRYARSTNPLVGINVKAVVLDFDGTVADTMPELTAIAETLLTQHYGLGRREARNHYLMTSGLPFRSQLEELFPADSRNDTVANEFEAAKRRGAAGWRPFSGARTTLTHLKRAGVQTFLCSSSARELVHTFVVANGLGDSFTEVLGYDGCRTKDLQMLGIMHKHDLEARDVVFVGDSLHDRAFAQRAGVTFIGLQRTSFSADFTAHRVPMVASLREFKTTWQQSRYLTTAVESP